MPSDGDEKTYGLLVGWMSTVTYIFGGTCLLGVPFVVWHAGVPSSLLTLFVVTVLTFIPVLWILETSARAEVSSSAECIALY